MFMSDKTSLHPHHSISLSAVCSGNVTQTCMFNIRRFYHFKERLFYINSKEEHFKWVQWKGLIYMLSYLVYSVFIPVLVEHTRDGNDWVNSVDKTCRERQW